MNNSQESFTPPEVIGWFSLQKMLLGQSTNNGHKRHGPKQHP